MPFVNSKREINVTTIYTNGYLVDEAFLDRLEERGVRPTFQMSFDGIGWHDFLRGLSGAEERTRSALRLLKKRGYLVDVSMCLHKKSAPVQRETVRLLASLGVRHLKCGATLEIGEWMSPEVKELRLTKEEELEIFERYIPQYFEDGEPLSITMAGVFRHKKGRPESSSFYHRKCLAEEEDKRLACPTLGEVFYIGADLVVAPCQGMCESSLAPNFPSLKEQPLREILTDSALISYSYAKVGDVRRGNEECRTCAFVDRCSGGCRLAAMCEGGNYYGPDPGACRFFKDGWEERLLRCQDFYEQQSQHDQNHRPCDSGAFFHGEAGADVIAGHVAGCGSQAEADDDLSV